MKKIITFGILSKKFLRLFVFVVVLFSVFSAPFFVSSVDAAGINNQINFQGKLVNSNGTNVADSTYSVVFSLYNVSSSGTAIWTETDSVTTSNGAFQIALGANTAFPGNVDFNNPNLYLGIKVGTDAEMTPRIRFSAVPYAFNAAALDGVVATQSATGFNLQGGTSSQSTLAVTTSAGALTFQPGVAEGLTIQSNGANGLTLDTGGNGAVNIGTGNATSVVFGKGSNNTAFTFNNGSGGFTVNGTGNITLAALNSADGLVYTTGTNGVLSQTAPTGGLQCLQSNSGNTALLWVTCSGIGTNFWQSVGNALSPSNITNDLLLGGTSTASARFAFTNNIGAGTPTASISANNGNNATYISGNGVLGTTNGQSLTLGSASTGNLQFFSASNTLTSAGNLTLAGTTGINLSGSGADLNFTGTGAPNTITTSANDDFAIMPNGSGGVGINTTNPLASLDVRNNLGTTATASVSGSTSYAGLVVNNSGSGDIITASSAGQTEFTVANDGTVELNPSNYAACGALSTDVSGNVNCSPGVSSDNLGMIYTITAASGTNLHINFTGAADAIPSSSSGTITFPANTTKIIVDMKGAGGGGGGTGTTTAIKNAGGGGEGGYSSELVTSIASNYYVKVGGGGVGATGNATGGPGTSSCFGTNSTDACNGALASTTGGAGGAGINAAGSAAGGAGGTGTGGNLNLVGQPGFASVAVTGASYSGAGGGISGAAAVTVAGNGTAGSNGGGGSGAGGIASSATSRNGGNGGNGYMVFYIYTNSSSGAAASDNWYQYGNGVLAPLNLNSDVVIGGSATASAKIGFLDIDTTNPIASIAANPASGTTTGLVLNSAGSIQSLNNNSLTIGGNTTGNIQFFSASNTLTSAGNLTLGGTLNGNTISAGTGTLSLGANTLSVTGNMTLAGGGNTLTLTGSASLNQSLLTSSTPTFANLIDSGLTTNSAVYTDGSKQLTTTAPTSGSIGYLQRNSGAISPTNITDDFLLGGISTASAKIALEFIAGGTPVASISAQSGPAAPGIVMSGSGSIQALNMNSLTFGGTTTGNLIFDSGTNVDQFNDSTINLTGSAPILTSTNALQLVAGANTITLGTAGTGGNIQFFNSGNTISNAGNLVLSGATGINLTGNSADINFSGTGTDTITTAAGQALALMPGAGAGVGVNTNSPLASFDIRGNTATTAAASVSAASTFAAMAVNNSGSGDLFTASKSGATKFVIENSGNIGFAGTNTVLSTIASAAIAAQTWTLPNATGTLCVSTNNCGFATGTNEWQQINGAISPTTIADDVLLGGTATTSARFAFINDVGAGTPTASISANSGNNATYMTGTGILSTTNNQSLTIGSNTTGNVLINPGGGTAELTAFANGTVGIGSVTSSPLATLDIRANSGTLAVASVSGSTSFAGLVINNSGSGDLFTASKSGSTKFVITNQGNVGIGTSTPLAAFDIRATSGTTPIASVAGSTSFAGLVVNNSGSGDLLTASSAGRTKFDVTNSGSVFFGGDTISASASGSTNNGSPDVINGLGDTGSLVPNSGFEADLSGSKLGDGWVPSATNSGTLILDTTQADAAQGTNSIKWTTTGTAQVAAFYSACFPLTGIAADTYNLVWAQKGSAANAVTVRGLIDQYTTKANCMSNTGLTSSANAPATAITNAWADTAGTTAIAPTAGTTWARVHIFMQSGANGVSAWIDSVRLIESSLQNGLDYAEDYPTDPNNTPQPGQVVSLVALAGAALVAPANAYMDQSVIGVVSTNPGYVLNDGSMTNPVPVALAGRVPVNVSTANGPIHVGDYLTSSSIPGVAVKATTSGQVIGTAMSEDTDTNTNDVGQVTMFVKNTYYNGGTESATTGLDLLSDTADPSILLNILQGVQMASSSALTSLTSGQVTQGLSYLITAINAAASQSASMQANATSSAVNSISSSATSGLSVNGSATVSADLHVEGNSLIEGILHIADTLFTNNFIANGVSDFFGNVIFHSGVRFDSTPVFDSDTAGFAVVTKGSDHVDVRFSIPYDQTPIINASITLNPLTPTPSETLLQQQERESQLESAALSNVHYIIVNRTTRGFTILLSQEASQNISFSWVALAVNSPMIFQSGSQNLQTQSPTGDISPSPMDTIIPTSIPVSPVLSPTDEELPTPTPGG
jgi:hypothetical protein